MLRWKSRIPLNNRSKNQILLSNLTILMNIKSRKNKKCKVYLHSNPDQYLQVPLVPCAKICQLTNFFKLQFKYDGSALARSTCIKKMSFCCQQQPSSSYFFVVRISGFPGNPANGAKIRNLGSLSMSNSPFIYHDFAPFFNC